MRSIQIRRLHYEEAKALLERELEEAFLAGERYVEIVHGIGGGVLKKMAHDVAEQTAFLRILPPGSNPGVLRAEILSPGPSEIRKYIKR